MKLFAKYADVTKSRFRQKVGSLFSTPPQKTPKTHIHIMKTFCHFNLDFGLENKTI
jgi:hypothetical protein